MVPVWIVDTRRSHKHLVFVSPLPHASRQNKKNIYQARRFRLNNILTFFFFFKRFNFKAHVKAFHLNVMHFWTLSLIHIAPLSCCLVNSHEADSEEIGFHAGHPGCSGPCRWLRTSQHMFFKWCRPTSTNSQSKVIRRISNLSACQLLWPDSVVCKSTCRYSIRASDTADSPSHKCQVIFFLSPSLTK